VDAEVEPRGIKNVTSRTCGVCQRGFSSTIADTCRATLLASFQWSRASRSGSEDACGFSRILNSRQWIASKIASSPRPSPAASRA